MSFAPPVSRDGFYYNGDLYVEVGNFNRHKRASVTEIAAILRPDIRKTKNTTFASSATPSRDPVGHWYEAQLIHYGLPPSKDKARAKIRLLEALNASALVVPSHIATLEASLKKQYEAAERKAKAQYKAGLVAGGGDRAESNKKRRNLDSTTEGRGSTVNVNINVGLYGGILPREARFGGLVQKQQYDQQQEVSPAKKAKLVRENGPRGPVVMNESAAQREPVVKMEPPIEMEPRTFADVPLGLINGYYTISCPIIESDFDCAGFSLILCLETPRIWGAYEFGPFTGILCLPQRPFNPSDEGLSFCWRGIDRAADVIGVGDSCVGEIAFLGQGRIAGRLNIYGDCEFTGMRQSVGMNSPRSAYSMRQEWESYNEGIY